MFCCAGLVSIADLLSGRKCGVLGLATAKIGGGDFCTIRRDAGIFNLGQAVVTTIAWQGLRLVRRYACSSEESK